MYLMLYAMEACEPPPVPRSHTVRRPRRFEEHDLHLFMPVKTCWPLLSRCPVDLERAQPQRDRGSKRGKTAAAPISPSQNRTNQPRSCRPGVILRGQKWRYTTRMAHDDENGLVGGRQSRAKHRNRDGPARPLTRMAHNQSGLTGRRAVEPRYTSMD